jgi:hypothetical protein
MVFRFLALVGLLFLGGCAYDAGYYESGYAQQPNSTAGYYPADYAPYLPSSPVYGAPYVSGPVMGGIYGSGDAIDLYGGPIFSPFHGISCDRRRNLCWGRNGPDPRWTTRFFGHRHAGWNDGDWHHGNGNHADWNNGGWNNGGWNHGGGNGHPGGPNPGGGHPGNQPWVYQVPQHPDGRGAPTFLPN